MPDAAQVPIENLSVRYERHDVSPRTVMGMIVGTTALIAAAIVVCWLLSRHYDRREAAAKASSQPLAAARRERLGGMQADQGLKEHFGGQPPLEGLPPQAPERELGHWQPGSARYQITEEDAFLGSYGWVDEAKGIGRVPVDRAARLALENRDKYLRSRPMGEKKEERPWWKLWR